MMNETQEKPSTCSAPWRSSLTPLADRPAIESLQAFLETLFAQRGDDVELVVLFGSMARGDWSRNSDYDVLIGLRQDPTPRFIDRLGAFLAMSDDGRVEALPFTVAQIDRMLGRFNLVVLAALRDGVVLFDKGAWNVRQHWYQALLDEHLLTREERGWRWTEEAEKRLATLRDAPPC